MHCPFCRHSDSRVIDSRTSDDGLSIRRRRQCPECGGRFSTIETASLNVIKRNGVIEPFSREKIVSGVRKACQGRPVTDADLAVLAQRVEETIRSTGASQIEANDIGLANLPPPPELDQVLPPPRPRAGAPPRLPARPLVADARCRAARRAVHAPGPRTRGDRARV